MIVLAWIVRDIKSGFPLANEHLGLGYIASVLRKKGFEVTIIPVELPSPQLANVNRKVDHLADRKVDHLER